ncbi:MAG TPA: YlbF family regulator [Syntrophomonadaceae bacterium]|nr:YlbF family regulator [Syntrophomonadaceae bacterium]HQE24199.1 YlbF family regulator [Syntrophomonadaceae bacterium]
MSANPYDKAHELARSILNHETFKNYVQAKNNLEQKPDCRDKVLEFRNRQLAFNRAQITGGKIAEEEVRQLSVDFAKLNQEKDIAAFFDAEAKFIQMFNDIQEIIRQPLDRVLAK